MDHLEVLVSIEDEHVGVVRDADGLWLTSEIGRGGTLLEDYRPRVEGLRGRRTVAGGRLPPRATGADVVDDFGNRHRAAAGSGAWVVVLEQPTDGRPPPVRYLDDTGATVASPIPDDWRRSAVRDAQEACPACGAQEWDQVTASNDSRGMSGGSDAPSLRFDPLGEPPDPESSDWEPTPFVRCRVCGHEESVGVLVSVSSGGDETDREEAQRRLRQFEERRRRAAQEALAKVDFPIYAPEGLEVRMNGWGGPPGGINRVTVSHLGECETELSIETSAEEAVFDSPEGRALDALESRLESHTGDWPTTRSEGGLTVWLSNREQEDRASRRRLMNEVQRGEADLLVEGSPQTVLLAEVQGVWAMAFDRDGVGITVSSSGVPFEEVRLVVLEDPVSSLFSDGE